MEKSSLKQTNWQLKVVKEQASIVHGVYAGKPFQASIYYHLNAYHIQINGYSYQIRANQFTDLVQEQTSASETEIIAPMEGLVVNVLVHEGQEIQKSETLLHLESMKLMLEIKAPYDSIVEYITVQTGQKVEANQTLVKLLPLSRSS